MTDDPTLSDEDAAALAAIEGMSIWEMIGELLTAAAHQIERRLGGPGVFRRLLSVLAAFAAITTTMAARQRAAMLHHAPVKASRILRHLRCPPSRWAGA